MTRIQTCKKFLDAVNFTGGTNATADPTAKFEDQIFYIDRVANENPLLVEFELASKLDLINVALPASSGFGALPVGVSRGKHLRLQGH